MDNNIVFKRSIEEEIVPFLGSDQIILIFGPRQVGKTTLAKKLLQTRNQGGGYFNCEEIAVSQYFRKGQPELLRELIGDHTCVVFDEAQVIEDIGTILKVFVDKYPSIQIIAIGSSSFDLANQVNEPLTGRAVTFTLLPLALDEIATGLPITDTLLDSLLLYGQYPAVVAAQNDSIRARTLSGIATNYLYKDVFTFERIKSPLHFEKLLQLLAWQIGATVSVNELATQLGVSRLLVEKYLRLLEQAFIIKRVPSFARNKRNELKRAFKVNFIDVGVRNIVVNDFTRVADRSDKGGLFESWCYTEILKKAVQQPIPPIVHFWRTHQQAEMDFVFEYQGSLVAIECKWGSGDVKAKPFLRAYSHAQVNVIRKQTVLSDWYIFDKLFTRQPSKENFS